MKVHTERKPYSRSDCEKSFAVDGRLMAHRRVHSGDKPHSCAGCGKRFSLSGNLKTHAWLHESGEKVRCHLCKKVCLRADNLRQHILSFHEVKNKEVKFLLDKPSLECIQKENRDHSYVPTNNVKEAKHKIGSVKMKKPVMVKDIRKLFNISSEWVNFNERIYEESKAIHTTEADMAAKLPKEFLDFSANKKCLEKIDAATVELIFPVPGRKKETAARQGGTHEIYCDLVELQEALCLTDDPPKDEESEGWVETEVCEDEPVKGTRTKEVIEERRAPQVKTLFTYTGRMHEVNKWITTQFALTVVEGYVNSGKHVSRVQELRPCFLREDDAHKETVPCKTIDISLILNLKELISAKREALGLKNQVHVFDKDADEMISSVPGMKAKISADEHRQVLGAVQGLRGRQRGLQEERAATQQQLVAVEKEAAGLGGLSPTTLAQIEAKREGAQIVVATLHHLSRQRGEKVNQRVKRSFSINRKLMALTNKIIIEVGKITSPDLTADLTGAETWIVRQKEPKSGIKEKQDSFGGKEGHFMSSKIGEEISMPNLQWSKNDLWENYNQLLVFLSEAEKGNACLTKGLTRMLDCMVRGDSPSDQEALAAADLQGGDSEQPERGLQGGEPVNRRTVFQYNTPTSASTSPLATLTLATTWKMPSSKWPKFKVAQVPSGPRSKWPKLLVAQVPSGPSSQWPKFPVYQVPSGPSGPSSQ